MRMFIFSVNLLTAIANVFLLVLVATDRPFVVAMLLACALFVGGTTHGSITRDMEVHHD